MQRVFCRMLSLLVGRTQKLTHWLMIILEKKSNDNKEKNMEKYKLDWEEMRTEEKKWIEKTIRRKLNKNESKKKCAKRLCWKKKKMSVWRQHYTVTRNFQLRTVLFFSSIRFTSFDDFHYIYTFIQTNICSFICFNVAPDWRFACTCYFVHIFFFFSRSSLRSVDFASM